MQLKNKYRAETRKRIYNIIKYNNINIMKTELNEPKQQEPGQYKLDYEHQEAPKKTTYQKLDEMSCHLLEIPPKIRKLEMLVLNIRENEILISNNIGRIETTYKQEISQETNQDGKKAYPNDDSRKAELSARLDKDPDYQEYLSKSISNKNNIELINLEIKELSSNMSCYKTILDFFGRVGIEGNLNY